MNAYHISDLERLTGIKAHTIRIWERRYKLIEPHRTSTNIRYYDDEQVKKLLKIATLLGQGIKISKVAELSDKQINAEMRSLEADAPDDAIIAAMVNELTAAMLTFDESAFEKVFSSAALRFGMYQAMVRVFYPFLKKTGLMWSFSEAMPVQEHFASAIIRRKLIVAIDGLPAPTRKSKTFLLFLPADEWHETGLLLSDYLIRSKGYRTIYLGQNVPADNLTQLISATKPSYLLTLYVARQDQQSLEQDMYRIATQNKNLQVLVGGTPSLLQQIRKAKNITLLTSPADLMDLLGHN